MITTPAPEVRLTCRLVHSAFLFKTKRCSMLLMLNKAVLSLGRNTTNIEKCDFSKSRKRLTYKSRLQNSSSRSPFDMPTSAFCICFQNQEVLHTHDASNHSNKTVCRICEPLYNHPYEDAHHIVWKATCMKFHKKSARYANLVVRFSHA